MHDVLPQPLPIPAQPRWHLVLEAAVRQRLEPGTDIDFVAPPMLAKGPDVRVVGGPELDIGSELTVGSALVVESPAPFDVELVDERCPQIPSRDTAVRDE